MRTFNQNAGLTSTVNYTCFRTAARAEHEETDESIDGNVMPKMKLWKNKV